MRVMRPFPKELLKKMFLKVLYENGENNIYNRQDLDFVSIICEILSEQLNVSELTEYEFNEIIKVVNELEFEGLVEPVNIFGSAKVKMLTEKGTKVVQSKLLNFKLPAFEIESFITRPELKAECLKDYLNGDYETALLKAFRTVEEIIRKVKDPSSGKINKKSLSNSYITPEGLYEEGLEVPDTEPDSLARIITGAMSWFKEPGKGKINDPHIAGQVLLYINIHLNILDKKIVTI
ncbi:MAG: hypothetical protein R6W90_04055 [Ignavibacteriaceae bacterium]